MRTRLVVALVTAIAVGLILSAAQAHGGGVGGGGIARMGGISRPARGPFRPTPGMSRPVPRATAKLEIEMPRWSPTIFRSPKTDSPGVSLSRPPIGELHTNTPTTRDVAPRTVGRAERRQTAHDGLPATIPGRPALATPRSPLGSSVQIVPGRPEIQTRGLQTPLEIPSTSRSDNGRKRAEGVNTTPDSIRPGVATPRQILNPRRFGHRSNRIIGSVTGERNHPSTTREHRPRRGRTPSTGPNVEDIDVR